MVLKDIGQRSCSFIDRLRRYRTYSTKIFDIATQQNKIIANDKDYRTNKEKYLPLGMREEVKVL